MCISDNEFVCPCICIFKCLSVCPRVYVPVYVFIFTSMLVCVYELVFPGYCSFEYPKCVSEWHIYNLDKSLSTHLLL